MMHHRALKKGNATSFVSVPRDPQVRGDDYRSRISGAVEKQRTLEPGIEEGV